MCRYKPTAIARLAAPLAAALLALDCRDALSPERRSLGAPNFSHGGEHPLTATFDAGADGFSYLDDPFRGTASPAYASGTHVTTGGFSGGGLRVLLGGIDNSGVLGMSGGWQTSFTLGAAGDVSLTLRYRLTQNLNYESDEYSEALVSVDGVLRGLGGTDRLARLTGDGNGGSDQTTGWQLVTLTLPGLAAGTHTVVIGGYNNKKTASDETTEVLIDDVVITGISGTISVAVENQPPTAGATASCTGLACNFTSTSSDPDGTITAYSWGFGDGATSTLQNPSHTYAAAGTYTVTLTVTDDQGATGSFSGPLTVSSTNQPPTAGATASCTGLACNFTSTSSDPDGTITAYSWAFGDGATSTLQNPSHTYAAAGSYTVTLTVTDDQGVTGSFSGTISVAAANQPPTAGATASCSGLTCSFTSTSSDPDGTITAYSWAFGDGGTSTAQNPSHTYAAEGTYTVKLTVKDDDGATHSVSKSVSVTAPNQAPSVNAGSDETVLLGLLYTLSASFSDPDNGPWSYTISWGDGSSSSGTKSSQGTISAGHTYLLIGSYTIRVTVTDSRGASGSDTKKLTVFTSLGGIL